MDEIQREVFEYLRNESTQLRLKGVDFYFMIERDIRYIDPSINLVDKIRNKKFIVVLFYGKWQFSPVAYLVIDEKEITYLCGAFDIKSRSEPDLEKAMRGLNSFFFNKLIREFPSLQSIDSKKDENSFIYVVQIDEFDTAVEKVRYFVEKIKPRIDTYIDPVRKDGKFGYYFFTRDQYESYLSKEPFKLRSNEQVIKRNLRLKSLRVVDFHGIKQTELNDLKDTVRWVVLTGENGFGKTSILQAIAAGLYGNYDETGNQLIPDESFIGVEYFSNGEVVNINSSSRTFDVEPKLLRNEIATYGSYRHQVTASVTRETLEEQRATTYNLFNVDGKLLNIEQLIKDTFFNNKSFFESLVLLFKLLIHEIQDIIVEGRNVPEVLYIEQDKIGRPFPDKLTLGQLATGFRNILAMVGDMVYRLCIRQNEENISQLEGIVIIDEFELHLHPNYQKLLPQILTTQFPNLQFIISTHSPIPLLGIPKDVDVALIHVSRSKETGIIVEKLDTDFSVLTPNAILTSPIFGSKDLIPESKPDNQMIQTEDTFEEVELDRKLKDNLNEFLSFENQERLLKLFKE